MQVARSEVGQRCREDKEVADGVTLVERVGEDGDEERHREAAVAEPYDEHTYEQHVQQREPIDEPPAVPAALVDDAEQGVEDESAPAHQHHRPGARAHGPDRPPGDPQRHAEPHEPPATPQAARDRLEVLEPLLEPGGIVFPTAHPGGGQALSASLQAGGPETFTDATNNTLAITSVELVLRKVELKPVERDACDESSQVTVATVATSASDGNDGNEGNDMNEADEECDELEAGPILVDLPLGGIERMFEATVPAGTYDELRFQIHKPSDNGDAADQAFLTAHPDFAGISIRMEGTFNGAAFTYTSALDVDQELRFNPPIEVTAGTSAKLTVSLDLSGWFRNSGTLVDPATAAEGGANEDLVRRNIIRSFQAFKDNNEDGRDDDHEGEDGGHP